MFSGLYVRIAAIAVLVVALLGAVWYVHGLRSKIEDLEGQKTVLETKLKSQNDAIEQLKTDSDARIAAAQAELDKAKEEAEKAKGKATIIYKTKPSTPSDYCKSALDLVNGVR